MTLLWNGVGHGLQVVMSKCRLGASACSLPRRALLGGAISAAANVVVVLSLNSTQLA
jgi:hypothetical protein